MKRGWLIVLLLSLGLNLGLGLNALREPSPESAPQFREPQEAGPEAPIDHGQVEHHLKRRIDRMSARLDLSDDQRDSLWRLHLSDGQEIIMRRRELQQARTDLHQLFTLAQPNLADIQAAQHRISSLQASLDSLVVRVMFHERALLTPEQRQAYRGFFPKGQEGTRGRHGPAAGRRGDRKSIHHE
jgi:Spy/CpxP family protein refolding chaperone